MFVVTLAWGLVLSFVGASALAADVASAPPPVAATALAPAVVYTRPAQVGAVALSPSGKHLAMLLQPERGRSALAVQTLEPRGKLRVLDSFTDADVVSVRWVNDERLIYQGRQPAAELRYGGAGTFAINQDGSDRQQLISWAIADDNRSAVGVRRRHLPWDWSLAGTVDDGSADVFVQRAVYDSLGDFKETQLARLNTLTGQLRNFSLGMPGGARRWWLDPAGQPRLVLAQHEGQLVLYSREAEKNGATPPWQERLRAPVLDGLPVMPLAIDGEGRIYARASERGFSALFELDPQTLAPKEAPLAHLAGMDLRPQLEFDSATNRLLGIHFQAEGGASRWFDPAMASLQKALDEALPGRRNRLDCGRCSSSRHVVVHSSSDRQPGEILLFDREKHTLADLALSRPWVAEAQQARVSFHRVTTRDGQEMPVYVTHPAGSRPDQALPTVVLVHGGPWVRGGSLSWQSEPQFLASRGYRVIAPEFRGSTGWGDAWHRAGWKQWGRAMQDDLADALAWAARQKLSDPARACIMGSSYGGYAALMGATLQPDLFRCALAHAAVTDLKLLYTLHWSDTSEETKRWGMPAMVGDPQADAAALAQASPLQRVAELKRPVLIAHGGADRRVPVDHWKAYTRAAETAQAPVTAVLYPEEGHGFFDPNNEADYLQRAEAFLAQHLGRR